MIPKPKPPKKEILIKALTSSMTDEQWDIISQLRGLPTPESSAKREALLNGLIHKATANMHGTNRNAAQELQQEACKLYSVVTGVPWGSSRDDDCEIKPRQSGQAGVDVVLSPRIRQELIRIGFPDCCECKNTKNWDLQGAVRQAKANTPKGSTWILIMQRRAIIKAGRIDPVVVMDLEDFSRFMEWVVGAIIPESWK